MDCPACGHPENKTLSTTRWPSVDRRKHECKNCGFIFGSVSMKVEDMALLESAALLTREWYEERESFNPDRKMVLEKMVKGNG